VRVRPPAPEERAELARRLVASWGSVHVVSRGRVIDASGLPALVCSLDGAIAGLATYEVRGDSCELVTIDAFVAGRGVGTALLDAVASEARRLGCRRLWLITTNDNLAALRFYQRQGMRIVAVHVGAIEASRRLKPSIPPAGHDGIPIRDEIELELGL
jgi:ribosomal protein S18 acetylase RimI-like enzyme